MSDPTFNSVTIRQADANAVANLLTLDAVDANADAALVFINNSAVDQLHFALGRISARRVDAASVQLDLAIASDATVSSGDETLPALSLLRDASTTHLITPDNSALNVGGTLTVKGAANLNNTLSVVGATTLGGALNVGSTLTVKGAASMGSTLNVVGATTLSSTLNIGGAMDLVGAAHLHGLLTVDGAGVFSGNLRIDGNVGIGVATPNKTLSVAGAIGTSYEGIYFGGSQGDNYYGVGARVSDSLVYETWLYHRWRVYGQGYKEVMTLTADGNLGIGTNNPAAPLHIKQTRPNQGIRLDEAWEDGTLTGSFFHIDFDNYRNIVFYHENGKGQFMNVNGAWIQNSDRSLKEDIAPLHGTLSKVLQLNPVSFKWRQGTHENIGFIAQDVEQIFPNLVSSSIIENAPVKGLAYTSFGVLAIAALQELAHTYEQRIVALERQLAALLS